ncbi:MAG: adenylate/guanylate cyclase domain-containing protein [Nitrosopumilaceae archaeon]
MAINLYEMEKYIQSKEFFDYSETVETRQKAALTFIEKNNEQTDPSVSDYLVAFSTRSQSYCVGLVDIVNSSKISASLSPAKLSQYYEIFLNSMSKIIGKFGGKVIKNIGDCLLYYFPNSINGAEEGLTNCLDSGLAMSNAQKIISDEMILKKLPRLNYRISADFGTVILMNTSCSSAIDLIGPSVNMCSKINHCAGRNEFVIGNDLREVAKNLPAYEYGEIQGFDLGFKFPYPVYRVESSYR